MHLRSMYTHVSVHYLLLKTCMFNCVFVCLFVCSFVLGLSSNWELFHSYGDVTITGEELQNLICTRHLLLCAVRVL